MATLKFDDGSVQFRQRIAVSLLSHRNLLIRNIHNDNDDDAMDESSGASTIGLRDYEVSFLRLIDALTNGTVMEINNTGTQLRFRPGILLGGTHQHVCTGGRSVSWFLEGILPLLPFGKEGVSLTLIGITDGLCEQDASVDYWKASLPPVLERIGLIRSGSATAIAADPTRDFLDSDTFSLQIMHRSNDETGRIQIVCPNIRGALKPIDWTDCGKFHRIRGTVRSANASQTARVAYSAKGILQQLLPNVWIHTERIAKPSKQQQQPDDSKIPRTRAMVPSRLSVTLTLESTTGCTFTTETAALPRALPEDVGHRAAATLLSSLQGCGVGVLDGGGITPLVLLYMCLSPEDVSRVRCSALSPFTIASLRLYKQAFGVEFKITPDRESKTVLLSCLGTGYQNMARAST
jgi:RNA 3'-terminal phosphate cyclase-like protein